MQKRIIFLIAIFIFGNSAMFAQSRVVGTISGGVVNGKAIELPKPVYPAAALAVGASGAVSVQVLIDENGDVISATAVSGHPLLRSAAEKAARNAKFRPTELAGQPVKVSGVITYFFSSPKIDEAGAGDSAGEVPANPLQNLRNVELLGISAALRVITKLNEDERLDSISNDLLKSLNDSDFEDLPEEFRFLKELPKQNKVRRAEILNVVSSRLRESATGSQNWYFSLGESLGDILADSIKRQATEQVDNYSIKNGLLKLKDVLISTPPDFPKDVLAKLTEIIEFSQTNNLSDANVLEILDDKLIAIGDILFESKIR